MYPHDKGRPVVCMLACFLYFLDQGRDIEELVGSQAAAGSNRGFRRRLYSTVRSSHANVHRGVRQINHMFQWAADVSSFSIVDKANLRHDEACAMLEFSQCLLILRSVLGGFLILRLAILACVI